MANDPGEERIPDGQIVKTGSNPLSLLERTSRMLEQAETVGDFIDVRHQSEAIRTVARKLQAHHEVLFEAARMTIRAEHRLGQLLAELPLAKGAPGNQRTKKVDRSPRRTGPLFLKELGISKNMSQRVQQIATIPEEQLEQWLARQCAKGKEPTLRGALRFAKNLQASHSTNNTDILAQHRRCCRDSETGDPDSPLALLQVAREHLKIVAEQLGPLYESPARPLEDIGLRTIRRYLQQMADTLADLDEALCTDPPCPLPQPPFRGGGGVAWADEEIPEGLRATCTVNKQHGGAGGIPPANYDIRYA